MDTVHVIGFSFKETEFSLLEKIVFEEAEIKSTLQILQQELPQVGVVILSTCNRLEIYFSYENENNNYAESILRIIQQIKNIDLQDLQKNSYLLQSESCIKHLFAVCAGLDSMIIGENFIVAQVKQAVKICKSHSNSNLNVLFNMALSVSKKIRNLNLSFVDAWGTRVANILNQNIDQLLHKKLLFIGAGSMMPHIIQNCINIEKINNFAICNRTYENAENLAKQFNIEQFAMEIFSLKIHEYDVIITCISNEENIFGEFINLSQNKLIIDLSMPPILNQTARKNNKTFTIRELANIIDKDKNLKKEISANSQISALLKEQLLEFQQWQTRRKERV